MANTDTPFGFKPIRHLNGNPWNGKLRVYYHSASDATAIYKGDVIKLNGSADATGKYPDVISVAGDTDEHVVGVAVAFSTVPQLRADPSNLTRNYCPASTEMYVGVCDDPDVIYEVQEDGDTTPIAAASVGLNTTIVMTAGSTTTGVSAFEIDSDEVATTNTDLVRILRLVDREDNALGAYAKWEVLLNIHAYKSAKAADPTLGK